ncbi:MAG: TonB family protein [Candidatus Omnitrophota bacterium]
MPENKTFKIAFLFSTLIHSIFFIALPWADFFITKKDTKDMETAYVEIKHPPDKKLVGIKPIQKRTAIKGIKPQPIAEKLPDIKKEDILKPPKPEKKEKDFIKPKVRHIDTASFIEGVNFEKMMQEEKDEAKKATYVSYYRSVREKIRTYANNNYYSKKDLAKGEVFLSFTVTSRGELIQVNIVDESSTDNSYLREIALNSIRDASPFPPFPEGMSQYQITFNVIISFEPTN